MQPLNVIEYFENQYKSEQDFIRVAKVKKSSASIEEDSLESGSVQIDAVPVVSNTTTAKVDVFGSVTYFCVSVRPETSINEAQCLLITLTNFFESLPYDSRSDLYTTVMGDVLKLPIPPPLFSG